MVRLSSASACATALLTLALHSTTVYSMFSVHEDLLAYPQYEVRFPDSPDSYITEDEAKSKLASMSLNAAKQIPTSSAPPTSDTPADAEHGAVQQHQQSPNSDKSSTSPETEPREVIYEPMIMGDKRFLCTIPIVQPPPKLNATERRKNRDDEEKELARATISGTELLKQLEGKCLYFVSGWWSYSFCYNDYIKQFHGLPPASGLQTIPPKEDPNSASYILGRGAVPDRDAKPELPKDKDGAAMMELQANGELKYLVQKLAGGTLCDITGKERKIEIQYHCSPNSLNDKIAFIKEVTTCCYLMVVYTPSLCTDPAFLPPPENVANTIECLEIMNEERIKEYKAEKEKQEIKLQHLLDMVVPELSKGTKPKTGEGDKQKNLLDSLGLGKYKIKEKTGKQKNKNKPGVDDNTWTVINEDGVEQMIMVQEMDIEDAAALLGLGDDIAQLRNLAGQGGGGGGQRQAGGQEAAEERPGVVDEPVIHDEL